ncbi:transposase [Salinibacter ruber]|uniref:transposase n=1 Tax=Salinibacter ruber TaxID=146919 RepID=UPI003C6E7C99
MRWKPPASGSSNSSPRKRRSGRPVSVQVSVVLHVHLAEDSAKVGVKALGDWFYRFKIHALIHWPTQMVSAAMLLPDNRSDQVAAPALARSTSGGVLLADRGYRGSDLFDCPCATTGRAAPGHPAGRKQLFGPLAPVHRSSLRPVLARPTGKPAAEGVPLQSGASRHRVPTR